MSKRCPNYVGVTCVDGNCPIALSQEYEDRGMDLVRSCKDCFYYKGCKDCALFETEYCDNNLNSDLGKSI